jgi:hypothetical protein
MDAAAFSPRLGAGLESLARLSPAGSTVDVMFDLAALALVVACFLFIFLLLWALERV